MALEDPYLKEAKFHIQFLLIHPFEDGNGRCARLLTSYHLCQENLPPIIITPDQKKEYCSYIENRDEIALANLFKESSKNEQKIMMEIYHTCKIDYSKLEKNIQKKKS